ncbi:MAG: hypothetical protein ACOC1F_14200 [Myxococcota bacterium]
MANRPERWDERVRLPPLFTLEATMLGGSEARFLDGVMKLGFPLLDSVFASLRKRKKRAHGKTPDDSVDTWRKSPFGKSDQMFAQRQYSFVSVLPTVCVTAGVLTLSLTIGSGEKFVLQAKPARMGALIGFRGTFD